MKLSRPLLIVLMLASGLNVRAQLWSSLLDSSRAIDWSDAGVNPIPGRTELCARLKPPAGLAEIQAALQACRSGQAVYLGPGHYRIEGTITIPSNVTLRGAGADQTVLDAYGRGHDYVIAMGISRVSYHPLRILGGAESAGARTLLLENASQVAVGSYLVVSETNDPALVSSDGVDGNCQWCDGEWSRNGQYARGQIVEVTAVRGDRVSFMPGLYGAYTHTPFAVPFSMSAHHAGVEDLAVSANNTGYGSSFGMNSCAYCWIRGVASQYTDGEHVEILWGFHDVVRDSYFSNAYIHRGWAHDAAVRLSTRTTATLVENNILDRTHLSIMFSFGPAGNVVGYNYSTGEFDSIEPRMVTGGIVFHAAHPQFNLLEGNVVPQINLDAIWGSSSHTTVFRNWALGSNRICQPLNGRGAVRCEGTESRYGFCAARALEISYLSKQNNIVGNLLGSQQQAGLTGWNGRRLTVEAIAEYPARRSWDAVAYNLTLGYGGDGDDGSGSGCVAPAGALCHAPHLGAAQLLHGNYFSADKSLRWDPSRSHMLPASFYLARAPAWWGRLPFPAIGPELHGGSGADGHSFGNPAQRCYFEILHGSEGGPGSPLRFNASSCYGIK